MQVEVAAVGGAWAHVAVTITAVPASPTVAGDDTVPTSVSFAATETSKTITFAANQDSDDYDESVTLGFGSSLPAGVSAGSQATTAVTINDDDPTAVTVVTIEQIPDGSAMPYGPFGGLTRWGTV